MKRAILSVLSIFLILIFVFPLSGCGNTSLLDEISPGADETKVVGHAAEYEILYDELRFVTVNYREYLIKAYGENVFDDPDRVDELKKYVENALVVNAAARKLIESNGISLNDKKVSESVIIQLNKLAGELSDIIIAEAKDEDHTVSYEELNKAYREYLEESALTDRYNRYVFSIDAAVEILRQKFVSDGKLYTEEADIRKYINDNFVHVYHVYVPYTIPGNDSHSAKGTAELLDFIIKNNFSIEANKNELKKRLGITNSTPKDDFGYKFYNRVISAKDTSEKMKVLIGSSYNKDMAISQNGYYFSHGEYDPAYEKAAYSLGMGEVSSPVAAENGYYIIQRLEIDENYVNANFDVLKEQYHVAYINTLIADIQDNMKFSFNEYGASLDLTKIK